MCSVLSLFYPATWLLIGTSFIVGALYFGRFQGRLCEHHRDIWRVLTQEKVFFDDGDQHGAIASRYFVSGKWKTLGDQTIRLYAVRLWMANVGGLLGCVGLILLEAFAPEASMLACFRE